MSVYSGGCVDSVGMCETNVVSATVNTLPDISLSIGRYFVMNGQYSIDHAPDKFRWAGWE